MPVGRIGRRALLAGSVTAAAGGLLTTTACQGAKKSNNTAASNASVALPTLKTYAGVKPDLAGTPEGVDPGFHTFPKSRPKSVTTSPGKGEKLTALVNTYLPIPPGPDKNGYWAGLNQRLGVDLAMSMVPQPDYAARFATTIAGNDLPDLIQMRSVPGLPQLLQAKFQDLTEHLSKDAVLDYPNLANLPTAAWKSTIYNGQICGVPVPRGAMGGSVFSRDDLLDAAGAAKQPASFAEFTEGLRAVTDAKKRRWAFSSVDTLADAIAPMSGEPTTWEVRDGKLVNAVETDEHRRTVSTLTDLWKAGVVNPDGFGSTPLTQNFAAGTSVYTTGGYLAWSQLVIAGTASAGFQMGLMRIPTWSGGGLAPWHLGSGSFSFTAFKKTDPDRVKLQLRVLDWLAAPFGTEEYFYRLFGREGREHTIDKDGNPAYTSSGIIDTGLPIRYLTESPPVLYQPGRPQDADTQHAYQVDEIPHGIGNPITGLFSDTAASKLPQITKALQDGTNQIIQGHKPLSDLDALLDQWRAGGGDAIRNEYQGQL